MVSLRIFPQIQMAHGPYMFQSQSLHHPDGSVGQANNYLILHWAHTVLDPIGVPVTGGPPINLK